MNQQPGPDRSTFIGIVLISLIMGVWLVMSTPTPQDAPASREQTEAPPPDPSDRDVQDALADDAAALGEPTILAAPTDTLFAGAITGEARNVVVETDRYVATFSTRGASLVSFHLKDYKIAGTELPVDLVSKESGALAVIFSPPTGRAVDTRSLYFQTDAPLEPIDFSEEGGRVVFQTPVGEGALRLSYTFRPDSYDVSLRVEQIDSNILTASGGYELVWDGGLPFTEVNVAEEAQAAGAYVRSGGEVERLRFRGEGAIGQPYTGDIDWVAVKNKYFIATLIPPAGATEGAELDGRRVGDPGRDSFGESYTARLLMRRPAEVPHDIHMYLGPMDLSRVSEFGVGLYEVVDYGFGSFMTRPIAQYVIAPLFRLLGGFIPNYGLVILVFALIIKVVLYPLTKTAYKSTARMRELQPKMEALKEQFADEPQKQQEAMIKLYKEEKINPLGGCLPLLLQYPIIIALWRFFQNSIQIRQESFLWAPDLSAPDPILHLPFEIPIYGDFVAGFSLIMALAMVVQMKVSMPSGGAGGAQMKVFMYLMPIILLVVFNKLASGLSLYYLAYNVLTVFQQQSINRSLKKQGIGEVKADPKDIKPAGKGSTNGRATAANKSKAASARSGRRSKR
ncbi:membrane protein insertase YidC [soil metagenome]